MLVVGTAGAVYPAAGLAHLARDAGAGWSSSTPMPASWTVAHAVLRGTAAQLLPLLLAPESMLPQSVEGPSGA
jgi:NAD-dependent deacetylase